MVKLDISYFSQSNLSGCGSASVRMVFAGFGIFKTEKEIKKMLNPKSEKGIDLKKIKELFDRVGFGSIYDYDSKDFEEAINKVEIQLMKDSPVIALINRFIYDKKSPLTDKKVIWENRNFSLHYVVITGIDKNFVYFNDPHKQVGSTKLKKKTFAKAWSENLPWKFVFLAVSNNFLIGNF